MERITGLFSNKKFLIVAGIVTLLGMLTLVFKKGKSSVEPVVIEKEIVPSGSLNEDTSSKTKSDTSDVFTQLNYLQDYIQNRLSGVTGQINSAVSGIHVWTPETVQGDHTEGTELTSAELATMGIKYSNLDNNYLHKITWHWNGYTWVAIDNTTALKEEGRGVQNGEVMTYYEVIQQLGSNRYDSNRIYWWGVGASGVDVRLEQGEEGNLSMKIYSSPKSSMNGNTGTVIAGTQYNDHIDGSKLTQAEKDIRYLTGQYTYIWRWTGSSWTVSYLEQE